MAGGGGRKRKLLMFSFKFDQISTFVSNITSVTIFLMLLVQVGKTQLVVNVKDKGGDVYRESIMANTSSDTVHLEFQKSDGTLVTQFIDFKNEVQIFKAIVLGEEERGQSQFQELCFVTRFIKNEFISSDAMSKLRQKNPSAIRSPEDTKGKESHVKDLLVDIEKAQDISPHILEHCTDAKDGIHVKDSDLKFIAKSLGKDYTTLLGATKRPSGSVYHTSRCPEVQDISKPCVCRYEICIGWYPCGLKYCRGKDSSGKVISYRCGIKTCRKCREFDFYVKLKQMCLWDEAVIMGV